jgi:uncharacterized protein YecT (DUF1311 family)
MVKALLLAALAMLAAGEAAAQQCAGVTRFPDRLICSDAGVRAADAAMAQAYEAVRAQGSPDARRSLLAEQRAWLGERTRSCAARQGEAEQVRCLIAASEQRRDALAAALQRAPRDPAAGLASVTFSRRGARPPCTITARYPVLPEGAAGGAAFAAAMRDAAIEPAARDCPRTAATPGARIVYSADYAVTLRTPRIIAVVFSISSDAGGAQPLNYSHAVAFDLARGRVLAIADLVDATRGLPAVTAACSDQLAQERAANGGGAGDRDQLAQEVGAVVGDAMHWQLAPDGATILFDRAPNGPFECTIPLATLQPLLPADSPLR